MTETIETRLKLLENNYSIMDKKLDKVIEKLDTLVEELDARYAPKRTQEDVARVMWIVISAFIVAVIGLVLKK